MEPDIGERNTFMMEAMAMVLAKSRFCRYLTRSVQAEEALAAGEVPVGCIFVRDKTIIAKARNRTNELRNVRLAAKRSANLQELTT
jgi:hypothetical protein